MTQVTVNVTEEHILNGIKGECSSCPVALAVLDIINPFCDVHVNTDQIIIYNLDDNKQLELIPEPAIARFILDYDGDKRVYPFDFEIDVPEEILC